MKIGDLDVRGLFVGGSSVSKAYLGADLVYSSAQPNNEIWYTTTDGNPIAETVLQYNHTLDASGTELTLQSNTYKGGKGVLSYSGDIATINGQQNDDDYLGAFYNTETLSSINTPKSLAVMKYGFICKAPNLNTITVKSETLNFAADDSPLVYQTPKLSSIVMQAATAPTVNNNNIGIGSSIQGILYYPTGSDYSTWTTILEGSQWQSKEVDDFDNLFYGMKLSPSSLELNQYQIDTNLYVQCSEDYGLTVDGDIKDYILLPTGSGDADLTGAKTRFTVALTDPNLAESKTGTITVKSATYTKTVPVSFYKYDYVETDGFTYITTDFIPQLNIPYRIESVQTYEGTNGTYNEMWGYDYENFHCFSIGRHLAYGTVRGYYKDSYPQLTQSGGGIAISEILNQKLTCVMTPNKYGFKELDKWVDLSPSSTSVSKVPTHPMTLGGDWWTDDFTYPLWDEDTAPRNTKMRFYDFKIYNNDTDELVAHYVPIQDGNMYNTVSGNICKWGYIFQRKSGKEYYKEGAKVISGNDETTATEG